MATKFQGLGVTAGTSAERLALAGMPSGLQFYETDLKRLFLWTGSAWQQLTYPV